MLAGLTMAAGLMAQGQKLTGRIIDKDYYPMDKAKVTVKGTNISTTTDKNGNYVLEEVPLILDSLEVTKGKKSYSESFPVMIKMKQAIMAKPVEWYVKAGYDMSYFTGEDFSTIKDGHGFHVGGGADIRMSRIMSPCQSALKLLLRVSMHDNPLELPIQSRPRLSMNRALIQLLQTVPCRLRSVML